jgi:hypothetical protein
MKKPNQSMKISVYESLLFRLNAARAVGNTELVVQILNAIDDWCWAHRDGNGCLTAQQVQKAVTKSFWRLDNV